MPFQKAVTGPQSDVAEPEKACEKTLKWTIQVKDGNKATQAPLENQEVTLVVPVDRRNNKTVKVTTDEDGYVTLIYQKGETRVLGPVDVLYEEKKWTARLEAPTVDGGRHPVVAAPMRGQWSLKVRVFRKDGTSGKEMVEGAKVTFAPGGDVVADRNYVCWQKQLPCGNPCTVTVLGRAIEEVAAGFGASSPTTVGDNASKSENEATVSRAGETVTATATIGGTIVAVDLTVDYTWTLVVNVVKWLTAETTEPLRAAKISVTEKKNTKGESRDAAVLTVAKLSAERPYTVTTQSDIEGAWEATVKAGKLADIASGTPKSLSVKAPLGTERVELMLVLRPVWSVKVQVLDVTENGKQAPIKKDVWLVAVPLEWKAGENKPVTGKTGAAGEAWTQEGLLPLTTYQVRLPHNYGATAASARVLVGDQEADVATADAEAVKDGVHATRSENNTVTLKVERGSPKVKVELRLKFPKVFIVGEGPGFPYAIGLAMRHGAGEKPENRVLPARVEPAPQTVIATKEEEKTRMWVLASQFDVDANDPGGALPRTLIAYRDDANARVFDARKEDCWKRLKTAYGEFQAAIFNNPHPGYGTHRCNCKGVYVHGDDYPGKYISVHTLGWKPNLTEEQVGTFRSYGLEGGRASKQKEFVQEVLGCRRTGGDTVTDFADDGTAGEEPSTIDDTFSPKNAGNKAFDIRYTHYTATKNTNGLWASVLRCFRTFGETLLADGGALYVHGSTHFGSPDVLGNGEPEDEDAPLFGFEDKETWCDDKNPEGNLYYANYATNFTSKTLHPSWFAKISFKPGEPNLKKAHCYRKSKG